MLMDGLYCIIILAISVIEPSSQYVPGSYPPLLQYVQEMHYFYGETVKYNEKNLEECLSEENIITQLPFHLTATMSRQEKVREWLSAVLILAR